MGEILQKWQSPRTHHERVILVERVAQIARYLQRNCKGWFWNWGYHFVVDWFMEWFSAAVWISYSFAKDKKVSVKTVLELDALEDHFHLPLSVEAYQQFCELELYLQSLPRDSGTDKWSYIWGNDDYSAAKAYNHLLGSQQIHPSVRWIWQSSCQQKHKVFFWLLLQDRLNTRGHLRRKNMHLDSYICELCLLQKEGKLRHLFLRCPFAKRCWLLIGVQVPTWLRPQRAVRNIKRQLRVPFAMEVIIIMCWSIWTERSSWLFRNEEPSIASCKATFKKEMDLVIHRSKKKYTPDMKQWLINLV
jgi:hypothetical protein